MVLPRNLRQPDPSTSLQGEEIIHMFGTYKWKSILIILHNCTYKYLYKILNDMHLDSLVLIMVITVLSKINLQLSTFLLAAQVLIKVQSL